VHARARRRNERRFDPPRLEGQRSRKCRLVDNPFRSARAISADGLHPELPPRDTTAQRTTVSSIATGASGSRPWLHDEVPQALIRDDSYEQLVDQLAVRGGAGQLVSPSVVPCELLKQDVLRTLDVLQELLIGVFELRDDVLRALATVA